MAAQTLEVTLPAGTLKGCFDQWALLTQDRFVLSAVAGYRIPLSHPPVQNDPPLPPLGTPPFSDHDVSVAISDLLQIGAISKCSPEPGQFLSSFFLVPKPNTSKKRFILNLKQFNQFVPTEHFQMEDGRAVLSLISQGDFLGKIDLHSAYYSVSIHPASTKYLRFSFQGCLYQFNVLPFGLTSAPFVFTKLLKPVLHYLRCRGFRSVAYLDDFLCFGSTYQECLENITVTMTLFESLGFLVNKEKSVLLPSTKIVFLGLEYDSVRMTVGLPADKRSSVLHQVQLFSTLSSCVIRDFASLLGTLNFCCQAIPYGRVYLKRLERLRFLALLHANQDFDARMRLPLSLHHEFLWWSNALPQAVTPIRRTNFQLEIFSDASNSGWGACANSVSVGGPWEPEQFSLHINCKELLAAFYGLRTFAAGLSSSSVLLRIDNTTAVAYVNKMGGIQSPVLNGISRDIWQFCEARSLFIFASYIPSAQNVDADLASRADNPDTEWELSSWAFHKVVDRFGLPDIDLFASHANTKCPRFFSWQPDELAESVDAFTRDWGTVGYFYAFPPFALLLRTLRKIQTDKASGVLVVPHWPNQPWFPLFHALRTSPCLMLHASPTLLLSPSRQHHHRLQRHLSLLVARFSPPPSSDLG